MTAALLRADDISPISPLYLPCISPVSPLYLPQAAMTAALLRADEGSSEARAAAERRLAEEG